MQTTSNLVQSFRFSGFDTAARIGNPAEKPSTLLPQIGGALWQNERWADSLRSGGSSWCAGVARVLSVTPQSVKKTVTTFGAAELMDLVDASPVGRPPMVSPGRNATTPIKANPNYTETCWCPTTTGCETAQCETRFCQTMSNCPSNYGCGIKM